MISQTWWGAQGRCVCSLWVTPASRDQGHQPRCLAPCPDSRGHWGARPHQKKGQHPGPQAPLPAPGGALRTLALVLTQALGQGRIHGAGSHHAGVRARRGRASPGLLRLPGPGGRQMDAGGSRDHTGQWGVGHSQDSRGSGLLTKIGGGAPGRDGLAQAGSLAWLRAAGGGSPQSSTCARAASDANARHVSARPLGESRGGCPWIPASPWDPALLRSERPDARAFLRHGRDRACVAPEPGSDLRRQAWGRGPHATPPCASIGWARGVL